jgi:hypothetical protein
MVETAKGFWQFSEMVEKLPEMFIFSAFMYFYPSRSALPGRIS